MNVSDPKDVLVLFSFRSHKYGYIEMLFDRLAKRSNDRHALNLHRGALKDLQITIKGSRLSIIESLTGRDLTDFDAVYFELWYKAQQQALVASRYLERHAIPYMSKELRTIMPLTKVGELGVLADNNVPLPHTFISSQRQTKKLFKKNPPIKYPLIVKAADGYGGKNNYLIHDYETLKLTLDANKDLDFVIQEFIPNECDYRCIVLGGKISLVLKRSRDQTNISHLNNTSAGAIGEVVELGTLSNEAQQAVLNAAKAIDRDQFAGVDLMIHQHTKKPYILEVNQTPQIEIGAEVDKKMDILLNYLQEIAYEK